MIYTRREGDLIRHGLNFYRPLLGNSIGFVLRLFGWQWYVRYSRATGMFYNRFERQ